MLRITNSGLKYAVIEIKNSVNLNYRLFIPGEQFKIGQEIEVTVEVAPLKKNQVVAKKLRVTKLDVQKIEQKVLGVATTVDVEIPKEVKNDKVSTAKVG